jgi:hypothetical protein
MADPSSPKSPNSNHQRNPTRRVNYEGVFHDRRFDAESSDKESWMYARSCDVKACLPSNPGKLFFLSDILIRS